MKPIFLSAISLMVAGSLTAQMGSITSMPAVSTSVNFSGLGNFNSVNAIANGSTTTLTATGATGYSWSQGGSTHEYYNPYTGKYESSPTTDGNTQANAPLPYDNSVIFDADVMINVKASSYTAIFSVTDYGTTVLSADSAMSARLRLFTNGLKKDSVKEADIQVDFITMQPVFDSRPENKTYTALGTEKPIGYKIRKNVHVMFYDHRKLDHIITDAAQAEIYDLVKVDYNVNNIEAAYDTLRKVAAGVIEMKRKTYLNLGFTTTVMTLAEGYDSKYPEERYEAYTTYVQEISAQSGAPSQHVKATSPGQEQTIFYNKLPYKQFDKVLNADIAEPGVQFFYKLRVKCRMEPVKTEAPAGPPVKPAAGTYKPASQQGTQPARKP